MNKLVSVLLPVYNGSPYILEFLNSLLDQTYRPLQILIADDYSTDGSYEICKEWGRRNSDASVTIICYRNKKNIGLSGNVANLASKAEGGFICLADQDDVWKKDKIEKQINYLVANPDCIICLCDRSITNDKLEIVIESGYQDKGYSISVMNFEEVIKHRGCYSANTMAIRNINENILNIPAEIVEHDTFIAVMASRYGTIDFLYEPLVLYRIHKNNLSGNYRGQFSKNIFSCLIKYYRIAKRVKKCKETDGKVIERELYERFNIQLRDYENAFLNVESVIPIQYAWKRVMKEFKEGKIGVWVK